MIEYQLNTQPVGGPRQSRGNLPFDLKICIIKPSYKHTSYPHELLPLNIL